MLNDREDKYEDHEESEYHFSDDDMNYEDVEAEAPPKPVIVPEQKESFVNKLLQSKRMLIAGAVFLVLVFVVYKMLSPSTPVAPSTDILPAAPKTVSRTIPVTQPAAPVRVIPVETANRVPASTVTVTTTAPAAVQQPVITANPPVTTPAVTSQPITSAQPLPAQTQPTATPTAAYSGEPVVTPQIPSQVSVNQMTANTAQQAPVSVDGLASMAATNEKLITQLQAEYAQKLNDYAVQSKALQEQMQTLNTRVAGLESQMNQLIQTLGRQGQPREPAAAPAMPAQETAAPRVGYNVQAIIPGRAWLRSDNGDTVTVAEGDTVKDLGKVTKIDPYDGVVEINTGNRTVSLSYGNGG